MYLITELWKPIGILEGVDFGEDYWISSKGRIFSTITNTFLSQFETRGYYYITLGRKRRKNKRVNRLVAIYFLLNPNQYLYVNHKDEDKLNNDVNNLEWCTAKYNMNYGTARERTVKTMRLRGCYATRPVVQSDENYRPVKVWLRIDDAKDEIGVRTVRDCLRGKRETYKGFHWTYLNEYEDEHGKVDVNKYKDADSNLPPKNEIKNGRPVAQIDADGNVVKVYPSVYSTKKDGYSERAIFYCLSGKLKTYRGFIWKRI